MNLKLIPNNISIMCGIFCCIQDTKIFTEEYIRKLTQQTSNLLSHRGPDSHNYQLIKCNESKSILMVHTRLRIVGDSTPQPLIDETEQIYLVINGEIFNWKDLSQELEYTCSKSDCEIIIPLYKKYIRENGDYDTFFQKLNGQFSFILYDKLKDTIFISRDHIGITPLYYGYDEDKLVFSSEMKCLTMCFDNNVNSFVSSVKIFYPRTYVHSEINTFNESLIYNKTNTYLNYFESEQTDDNLEEIKSNIREKLTDSVQTQLDDLVNSDSPEFGVLLSGGLDSSLVASLVSKLHNKRIKTFSIGMTPYSTDLIASRKVAQFLGTEHYEFYFTVEDGLNSISDVIWYTETYDTTTVRASTAMYLLTKKIKEKFPNLKVLFSGELSDEMLSYLYGGNAPSESEFQKETIQLVSNVHMFDCLRANKTCMANSIEVRVPFTDPNFVKYILSIPAKYKVFGKLTNFTKMEKQILREAFDILDKNNKKYLPNEILFRKKEAFSDGVSAHTDDKSLNWIDSIIDYCDKKYSNLSYLVRRDKYTVNKPNTKEQLYYRDTFCKLFNKNSYTNTSEFTVKFWEPKWCGESPDPSARKHINTKEFDDDDNFEKI